MKLGAYKINSTPVSEMESVDVADLQGNAPYMVADKLPAAYKNISSIESFDLYGPGLIGSAPGFMDWKCLQREIKVLVMDKVKDDLAENWNKLNAKEKRVACQYLLGRIAPAAFAAIVPDAGERSRIAYDYDLNNRKARGSRSAATGRIQAMRLLMFEKLGSAVALEVMSEMVRDGLFELYEGGIEGSEEDAQTGINDFFLARKKTPYTTNGLKKRKYEIADGSGDTLKDLADRLADIVTNGTY
jgi:hypothetical protein